MEQKGFDFTTKLRTENVELRTPNIEQPKVYSVSELTKQIRQLLEGSFAEVWVTGEISNFRNPTSGHFYFTLKDEASQIPCVMFRGSNSKLLFQLADGLKIVCRGRVTVYEARGAYQIVVEHCEPKGVGALQLAFEQLKKKLHAEGLFDAKHKVKLPFLPKKIGVVTSSTGAAIRDILNILKRRFPGVSVLLVPVKVQGEGAAAEIAEAIGALNERDDIDVMIVGRGGGSLEDLWAFNEEVVARAIFASLVPVISAVGHEIDFTIADFVADIRAPTPSAAAELAVPRKVDLVAHVAELKRQLLQGIALDLESKRQAWQELRQALKDPSSRFADLFQRMDDLRSRLQFGWRVAVDKRSQNLKKLFSNLDHLSPLNVLAKGYSVVQQAANLQSLKSAKGLQKGDDLTITFFEGKCLAKVTQTLV